MNKALKELHTCFWYILQESVKSIEIDWRHFFLDTSQSHDTCCALAICLSLLITPWQPGTHAANIFSQRHLTFYIYVEEGGVMGCRLLHNSMCCLFFWHELYYAFLVWFSFTVWRARAIIQASILVFIGKNTEVKIFLEGQYMAINEAKSSRFTVPINNPDH